VDSLYHHETNRYYVIRNVVYGGIDTSVPTFENGESDRSRFSWHLEGAKNSDFRHTKVLYI
jgi:hypothetical protein